MEPLGIVAIIFISMAVVINVLGQFTIIWDFLGIRRPHLAFPLIAFLGTVPFMLLLSAIVTISVAPAGSNISLANELASLAIQGAAFTNILALISLGLALWYHGSRFKTTESKLACLPARLIGLLICDVLFCIVLFNLIPIPFVVPSSLPFMLGLGFTILPVIYSVSGLEHQDRK